MTARQTVFRAAGIVSGLLVLSRLLGYVREALLAARFGATHVTDAYLVAQEVPLALFAAIGTALVMVFIPVYREVVQKRGVDAGRRLAVTVLNATLLLAVVLVFLGWATAPFFVPRLVPGLPAHILGLAVSLTRTMLPVMLFLGLSGVFAAVLNANRFFIAPALVGFVSNVVVIGALLAVTGPQQIHWVAWAVVGGAAAAALVQLPWLKRLGFSYQPSLDLKNPVLMQIGRLILPVIVTTFAVQMQNVVDRFLASNLVEGSISALNYAVRINSLPYGVIGAAISTVLYPGLAEHAAVGDEEALQATVSGGLRTLAFVLLPMSLGVVAFREPIVQIVFQRGAFDPRATAATAYALAYYAVGILFFGWLDFVNRCFFVVQDTLTPMWISLLMVLLNIGLNIALVGSMAQGGLALGTSLSTAIAVGLLLWQLKRRMKGFAVGRVAQAAAGNLASAAAGTAVGLGVYHLAGGLFPGERLAAQAFRLGSALGTIVVVHVLLAAFLGNREGADLAARLALRLKRGKS
ncbi:MAG TPA: murein biosynthesis integral membrane protein MurJ [Symbiobacteriaceae bacterium]|jgi:putative peptidoglycan lipid II flippase